MTLEPIDYRLKDPFGEWLAWIEICALYNINAPTGENE